jgi:hypothetical protein
MPSQRISITMDFPQPVEALFAFIARHENQSIILAGSRAKRLRDGEGHPDGVASVRQNQVLPLPSFEETVTVFEPPSLIEYRITRGSPLRNHHGVIRFTPQGTGTRLDYTITFDPKIPLTGWLLRVTTERGLRKGLKQVSRMGTLTP